MVEQVSYKSVTLGGMILEAQRKMAQGAGNATPAGWTDDQKTLADQVDLSDEARTRLAAARNVANSLGLFGSFLKLLNSGRYGIRPPQSGPEQSFNHSVKNSAGRNI